jgi:hypothetical protein
MSIDTVDNRSVFCFLGGFYIEKPIQKRNKTCYIYCLFASVYTDKSIGFITNSPFCPEEERKA